jgi:hypothetical protein
MRFLLMLAASLSLMAGIAAAQTAAPGPEALGSGGPDMHHRMYEHMHARSHGAAFSLDRGTGQGRIKIQCADRDTTRECVEAVLPLLEVLSPGGAPGSGSGVAYATTSIKCGGTVYEVSTGTSGGNCAVSGPENGPRNSAGCNDGGNQASASCDEGCGATSGAGSCTIKSVP